MGISLFSRAAGAVLLALLAFASAPAWTASPKTLDEAMSHDGLRKVRVKGIDAAYVRPGANLAEYKRVEVDPVEVAFHKSWDPSKPGSALKLSSSERESIRTGVAKLVQEEFVRALGADRGYRVVDEAGPDVLRVRVNVVNLYVTAPDTGNSMGRSPTYIVSAGEMTLFAELIDSESGEVIARVVDRREARGLGPMMVSSGTYNQGEARAIAAGWARVLRKALDNAHGISGGR